jgi:hypothetical protein
VINGIKWGTHIKDLPDMVLLGALAGGKRVYTRNGEKIKLGDADVEAVMYGFYRERLEDVQIHFRSSSNLAKLKGTLFLRYGPGRQPVRSMETYHWGEKDISIFLAYNQILEKGAVGFTFMPIYREEKKDRKLTQVKYEEMVEYFKNVKKFASKLVGDMGKKRKIVLKRRVTL